MGVDQLGDILAVEGGMAGDGFVKDAAERVEISPVIDRQALKLLGRHVVNRTHERIEVIDGLGLRRIKILGQAEVQNLDGEQRRRRGAGDHEVSRLEVAMNQAQGMGGDDGLETLLRETEKVLILERAANQNVLEGFAFDQFHDDVSSLCVDAVIEDGDDVGMLEAGGGHRLAPSLFDESAVVLDDLHPDPLDGHRAVEMVILGPVDIAQPTAPN